MRPHSLHSRAVSPGAASSRMKQATRGLSLLGLLILAGCKTELYNSLPEQEANEMVSILQRHGISAGKMMNKDGTDTVTVDKSDFAQAVTLLRENGLPHPKFENMGDVFKSSGLVASPMQDRARFLYALSQELSQTISEIDGVLSARVEVVLPDNDIMQRNPTPSSASVFVRYDQHSHVDQLVPQIKMLVSNSVEGLSYDKVSVVLVPVARPDDSQTAPVSSGGGFPVGPVVGGALLLLLGALGFSMRHRLTGLGNLRRGGKLSDIWSEPAE